MNKLILQANKPTFSDIETQTNLSERQSKQLMEFINKSFDVNGFNVEHNTDLDIISISLNENVTNDKIKLILNKNKLFGKNKFTLRVNDFEAVYEFENSFVKHNLNNDFTALLNDLEQTKQMYD